MQVAGCKPGMHAVQREHSGTAIYVVVLSLAGLSFDLFCVQERGFVLLQSSNKVFRVDRCIGWC